MTGKSQEIHIQPAHIDRQVRDGLGSIQQHQGTVLVGFLDDLRAGMVTPSRLEVIPSETKLDAWLSAFSKFIQIQPSHPRRSG